MPVARPLAALALASLLLAGCGAPEPPAKPLPRVRVEQARFTDHAVTATLTGDIQARVQTALGFRVGGKIIERRVEVGDHVSAQQVLARLDPQDQQNNLFAVQAAAEAARAQRVLAEANLWRQQQLLPKGYTSQSAYDSALAAQRSARNALTSAEAQLADAREQLGYTELRAELDGIITARQAEVGQVVQAAAPIFQLARDGDRDAVFNVHETLLALPPGQEVQVMLLDDPRITARGRVREVTPTVAAQSGTLQVKVALQEHLEALPLGAEVSVSVASRAQRAVELPWSALTKAGHDPAVWRLGDDGTVQLRPVQVGRYLTDKVLLSDGLQDGDRVIVAGGQLLHPGQRVEVAP